MSQFVAKTAGERRGYGLCLCSRCGVIGQCTPDTDYYGTGSGAEALLVCEKCTMGGAQVIEVRPRPNCALCHGSGRVVGNRYRLASGEVFSICACADLRGPRAS